MMKSALRPMLNLFLSLLLIYIAILALMFVFQRSLMYHPFAATGTPEQNGLSGFSELHAPTPDGIQIQLWYRQADRGFPTIVYFHGNGGNIAGRAVIYDAFARLGFGVLAVSYRGYGLSNGSPSEQGLYTDARTAIELLIKEKHVEPSRIILFGESLGTGVATKMATEYKVGLLVLQAPYTSVAARAQEIYPFVPARLLMKDRFDNLSKIQAIQSPLLLFHGELDNVIPVHHGRRVFESAREPKRAFFLPHVNHNDFDSRMISSHAQTYAKELGLIHQ
ncbi:MAG: alpha/beta hydrolase [Rickettsiales bacterium]|jgi:fermentation-respiration switch protein FrsA (DUF1100 family)|nr:alpha/beta hydrolase [Rickettsiales bacterium]